MPDSLKCYFLVFTFINILNTSQERRRNGGDKCTYAFRNNQPQMESRLQPFVKSINSLIFLPPDFTIMSKP